LQKTWTIVTVTHNSGQDLERFWTSGIPREIEWLVIDNASSDDSTEIAYDLGAKQVVALPNNIGFSAACNVGLSLASGQNVAFVNPDVSIIYQDLDFFSDTLSQNNYLLAPQLLYPDRSKQPNGRGEPRLGHKILGRLYPHLAERVGYYLYSNPKELKLVSWVIGAAVLGKKSTFDSLGGWSEEYFLYYEDADLCLRALSGGIPTFVVGSINWVHGWNRATIRPNWTSWKSEFGSLTTFYKKYPDQLRLSNRHMK
jgi:N-acetylglucosaminyl-diphospho-decaprenol L-rhamnosyltransferase